MAAGISDRLWSMEYVVALTDAREAVPAKIALTRRTTLHENGWNVSTRPRICGRMSSLAHAFVHAIIPRYVDSQEQQRLYERAGIKPTECVYCGSVATDSDHFRGLVKDGRPSGYFHTSDNLVPSCGPCNQSKGATDWRKWMTGSARRSPTRRGIQDVAQRIQRLSAFEAESKMVASPAAVLREAVGTELWDAYWAKLDQIRSQLLEAEEDAATIRLRLDAAFKKTGPQNSN